MSASYKTRMIRKKAKARQRKVKLKNRLDRLTQDQLNNEIIKLNKSDLFKASLHEVGHAVVRRKLMPEAIMKLWVYPSSKSPGFYLGRTIRCNTSGPDEANVVSLVSIAGVIAETLGTDDHKYHSFLALQSQIDDLKNFDAAKKILRDKGCKHAKDTPKYFFEYLYNSVIKEFENFNLRRMIRLSHTLAKVRVIDFGMKQI